MTVGRSYDPHLPRILCLHGGGSNARIFRAQCRALNKELSLYFRLVFVEGPWPSEPGPDVTSVYRDFGPYRRWLGPAQSQPQATAAEMRAEIDEAILRAMMESNAEGADGEWIALMGFSQGAMVAASLLLRHQLHANNALSACGSVSFRFAILMAGSAPLVSLDPYTSSDPAFVDAARYIPITGQACPSYLPCQEEHVLRLSTIHVHGLKDPGLARHRCLLNDFCAAETSMLVEWDGQHRVPIRTKDVAPVVNAIISVAVSSGALRLF